MLRRRMWLMLAAVLVVVLILAGYKAFSIYQQIQQFSAPQPAISVEAEQAQQLQWQSRLPAIGSLKALQGVNLTVEVAGTVRELLFSSGQQVKVGQPLVQMDGAVEQASLATAQAELGLSQVEFERGRSLVNRQSISKSEYDRLSANLQKATASVAQLQAQLAKKRINAPFSGTIGIRQIDVGDYLSSGTVIATLQDLSELYVDFFLPEQDVPLLAIGQQVEVSVAAYPQQTFKGKIAALNPRVEDSTRNIQVRAVLPNPNGKLLPGMFANLQVLLPQTTPSVVVSELAVTYTLYGNSLYVIKPKLDEQGQPLKDAQGQEQLQVERRFIQTGERRDGQVVISKGLSAGERVVTSGQLKLDNGAHVSIVGAPSTAAAQ
ncbi:efflux RND transporter periplasmic adaptor subunit [Pseudomonas sp. 5P_3.1_Bac2]|uniref:efflux RND transporter periplasmic adaptor subunit n=1 Tax=Pseudomonas sp. 5P_3.1_Bac2 TaxID=2971617 RepID=UPI0021C643C7|nr:efflux RND transporter periplasmic adaptor subunit [Pseudomonas sp. 5P_3.1_Bac2]MCU1715513.1 efflux RND transporter periplasmic adaptor subunit [Pseudomonas sp. 5P_3.1_Bac2]